MRGVGMGILLGSITAAGLSAVIVVSRAHTGDSSTANSSNDSNSAHRDPNSFWTLEHQLVTRLLGRSVENRDGQYFGRVKDFILDRNSGKVLYLVISYGGWLGLGRKLRAVPAQLASTATSKVGVMSLNVGRRRWERAPVFAKSDLAVLSKDTGLDRYYSLTEDQEAPRSKKGSDKTVSEASSSSTYREGVHLEFATDLLGKKVSNSNQSPIGDISDLLIDLTGSRPTLAILIRSHWPRSGDGFAISWRFLKRRRTGSLLAEVPWENFIEAQMLTDTRWQNPYDAVYRFPNKRDGGDKRPAPNGGERNQSRTVQRLTPVASL